ncbi:FAD-dependent oxidoreductase [Roseomonas hellenica]|uniref:FAD-dependent oxidoreductase n=1 Tax=Plastoroseomonas hellenica TaxID=2687306 RepID=A0ABS5EZI7_9PROT|nr:FAD-dependent oxidoreductase [Plastoroseomonas hellenica]MBR0665721.1 FAD-dependent oxidoreductase [Plastoroseomonas hellenica]
MRVVVIGGGILGACTAYHLMRAGAEVILLDRAHEGRATSAGAGIVSPWTTRYEGPALYTMLLGGAEAYPALVAALAEDGETDLGYRRVGTLCAPEDPAILDDLEPMVRARAAASPAAGAVTRLTPAEAGALFPALAGDRAALHVEGGARLDGRRLSAALHRAIARRGGTLKAGTAALLVEGSRLRGVTLDGERIEANAVVLAAGAWAPALLAPLGLRLAIAPQRGQILHLRLDGQDTAAWPVLYPMTSHYLLTFEDGRVVVGATRETGSGFDYRVTAGGLREVLEAGLAIAPGLAAATHVETRVGFRPMSPDGRPLLGTVPGLAGLVIANGLGPSGLTISPFAGRIAAALALGETPELDLAPYDPLRG